MTVPAPSDRPGPADAPATDNPWAPPGPIRTDGAAPAPAAAPGPFPAPAAAPGPFPSPGVPSWAPYPYPYPMPAPQPRNGLGVAAMVLGIVGTVLGLAVILFWLSWLLALLAVILGAVALAQVRKGVATNRGTALAGVILGVVGLLVSTGAGVLVVAEIRAVNEERKADEAADRARAEEAARAAQERAAKERERLEAERRRIEAERAAAAADEKARHPQFGQSYTFPDGLKVTMARPERYVPDETVLKAPKNARIIQVRITIVNTGSAEVPLRGSGLPVVRDANGVLVLTLIDGSGRLKVPTGTVAPGKEVTSLTAYGLPETAADPFSVEFVHHAGPGGSVVWSGPPS
ncbi:DUF4190 domain-containing protein [Kitasatospora sp. NPDC015120]|uniref:DUF4190 domain-containing protein n=1 Tax=Kitasatospora sp. NPDC015120 TaxID=3364023 RepID=UPI0036F48667